MNHDLARAGQEIDLGFAYRFRLGQEIGRSSYGVVWQAIWLQNNNSVAIKTVPRESMEGTSQELCCQWPLALKREAAHLRHLHDGHIVRYLHSGTYEGMPVLVLEQLHETLPNYLRGRQKNEIRPQRLPLAEALKWIRQVAHGLAAVHRAGLQHLDIKPSNLLLTAPSLLGHRLKIADFGTCQSDNGQPHIFMGTPGWLAPEQTMVCGINDVGEYLYRTDARSDVYALGLLLFQLVTGERTEFSRYNQLAMCSGGESCLQRDGQFSGELSSEDLARFTNSNSEMTYDEPILGVNTDSFDQHTWRPQFPELAALERDTIVQRRYSTLPRPLIPNQGIDPGLALLETFCSRKPTERPANGRVAFELINQTINKLKIS